MTWCVIKFDDSGRAVARDTYEQGDPFLANSATQAVIAGDQELARYPWLEAILPLRDEQGLLTGARLNPDFVPPSPAASLESQVAELKQLVQANLLTSAHDKRWLEQKEAAKHLGIAWLKANPSASQTDFEAALATALAAEFPAAPMVINPAGAIASYALVALDWGLIADASFESLRDFVAATPETQLQKLLAQL